MKRSGEPVMLKHNRIDLALWPLRDGDGDPLLVLHGLGEHTNPAVLHDLGQWPGPVWGLDFTGHGASTVPAGGGYYCEALMADADIALAHMGSGTVFGRGLGGYVGLLLAGARPDGVRGAIIADGPGLNGGGPVPATQVMVNPEPRTTAPDPFALLELAIDIRPPDYASELTALAARSGRAVNIAVVATNRPPWLAEVVTQPGVKECTLPDALELFAG